MRVYRPSEGAVEEDPVISLVGEALRMGSDGRRRVGEVRRRSGVAVRPTVMTVATSRRWLHTLFEIGLRVCWWGGLAHGEPRTMSRRPPPLYIAQCDGGPPTM